VPALPEFMAAHPSWNWRCRARIVKLIWFKRGLTASCDLVGDETLIARPLGLLRVVNAASPAYLARYGIPRSLEDLHRQEHRTIHFSTMLGARPYGWEYPGGDSYATLQLLAGRSPYHSS
jgi:DNA-binding transcriptional LysR family regulator